RDLHACPTRRSSDLSVPGGGGSGQTHETQRHESTHHASLDHVRRGGPQPSRAAAGADPAPVAAAPHHDPRPGAHPAGPPAAPLRMTRTDRSPGRGPTPTGGGAPRRRPRPSGPTVDRTTGAFVVPGPRAAGPTRGDGPHATTRLCG